MTRSGFGLWALSSWICLAAIGFPHTAFAQDMPDPSVIHGRALPAPELPDGTVTVRVVREAIGNDAPGQQVRVTVGGTTRTATTDQEGRAEFKGLPSGEARAEATVDGETMQSQPFAVPASGGLRVILVAGLAGAAERRKQEEAAALAAPPTKGTVILGENSRIVMEFDQDSLWTYYLLEVVNTARNRVDIGGPLRIELPPEATGVRLYEGSTEGLDVEIDGTRVSVKGPFAPGTTLLNLQYGFRFTNSTHTVTQAFPVPLQSTLVGIEKVGSLGLASPQFSSTAEVPGERGSVFLVGRGGSLSPGTPLTFTMSNLPVQGKTGLYVALGLALLIGAAGTWMAMNPGTAAAADRRTLIVRRDKLLADLAPLEAKRRDGALPEKAERRRQRILGELEQIYAELDATAGPQGGGEGIAA